MGSKFTTFKLVRYVFFVFNVIFWLMGCSLLGVGIWLHLVRASYGRLLPSYGLISATALCVAAGIAILIVGFFGCCGAIMENSCMLLTYFVLMVFVFVLELTAGALALTYKSEIKELVEQELLFGIKHDYGVKGNNLEMVWDKIHVRFDCCGVNNYTDWYNAPKWEDRFPNSVPRTCCKEVCAGQDGENMSLWKQNGCLDELKKWFTRHGYIMGVVGLSLGLTQIFGLVTSMVLFCILRSEASIM